MRIVLASFVLLASGSVVHGQAINPFIGQSTVPQRAQLPLSQAAQQQTGRAARGSYYASQPVARPRMKPFSSYYQPPAVSPYLNLFLDESSEAAPNYFAFVQPQLRQLENARQQHMQTLRMQRDTQSGADSPEPVSAGTPQLGETLAPRYMNLGKYYSRR